LLFVLYTKNPYSKF